jgi:hypothetical protein
MITDGGEAQQIPKLLLQFVGCRSLFRALPGLSG